MPFSFSFRTLIMGLLTLRVLCARLIKALPVLWSALQWWGNHYSWWSVSKENDMWHCSLYCFSLITEFLQQQMSVLSQWHCCIFGTEQSTYWHDRLHCVVVLSKLWGYRFSHCFVSKVSLCLLEVEITRHPMIELQFFTHDTILLHFFNILWCAD